MVHRTKTGEFQPYTLTIKFDGHSWRAFFNGEEMHNLYRIKMDIKDNYIEDPDDVQLIFNHLYLQVQDYDPVL